MARKPVKNKEKTSGILSLRDREKGLTTRNNDARVKQRASSAADRAIQKAKGEAPAKAPDTVEVFGRTITLTDAQKKQYEASQANVKNAVMRPGDEGHKENLPDRKPGTGTVEKLGSSSSTKKGMSPEKAREYRTKFLDNKDQRVKEPTYAERKLREKQLKQAAEEADAAYAPNAEQETSASEARAYSKKTAADRALEMLTSNTLEQVDENGERTPYTVENNKNIGMDAGSSSEQVPEDRDFKDERSEIEDAIGELQAEYEEIAGRVYAVGSQIGKDYTAEDNERLSDIEHQIDDYKRQLVTLGQEEVLDKRGITAEGVKQEFLDNEIPEEWQDADAIQQQVENADWDAAARAKARSDIDADLADVMAHLKEAIRLGDEDARHYWEEQQRTLAAQKKAVQEYKDDAAWWKIISNTALEGAAGIAKWGSSILDFLAGEDSVLGHMTSELKTMGAITWNDTVGQFGGPTIDETGFGNVISNLNKGVQSDYELFSGRAAEAAQGNNAAEFVHKHLASFIQNAPFILVSIFSAPATATTAGVEYAGNLAKSSGFNTIRTICANAIKNMAEDRATQYAFVQSFGDNYEEAKAEIDPSGKGGFMVDFKATMYALVNSYFNAMIETGGGQGSGIETYWETLQGGGTGSFAEQAIDDVLDEIKEEELQGFFERGLKSIYQKVTPFSLTDENAIVNPDVILETAKDTFIDTLALMGAEQVGSKVAGMVSSYNNSHDPFDLWNMAYEMFQNAEPEDASFGRVPGQAAPGVTKPGSTAANQTTNPEMSQLKTRTDVADNGPGTVDPRDFARQVVEEQAAEEEEANGELTPGQAYQLMRQQNGWKEVDDSGTGTPYGSEQEVVEEAQSFVESFTKGPTAITDSGTGTSDAARRAAAEQAAIDAYYQAIMEATPESAAQNPEANLFRNRTDVSDTGTGTSELARRKAAEQAAIDAYYQAMADANEAAAKPRMGEAAVNKPGVKGELTDERTDSNTGGSEIRFNNEEETARRTSGEQRAEKQAPEGLREQTEENTEEEIQEETEEETQEENEEETEEENDEETEEETEVNTEVNTEVVEDSAHRSVRTVAQQLGVSQQATRSLVEGLDIGTIDAPTYTAAVREVVQMAEAGYSPAQVMQNSELAQQITPTQFERAYQIGAELKGGEADVKTKPLQQNAKIKKLEPALASLGEYAEEAAAAYEPGQDVGTYAAAMNQAVGLYAAQGMDFMNAVQQARKSGGVLGTLTGSQLKTVRDIGKKMQADKKAAAAKKAQQRKETREKAKAKGAKHQEGKVTYAKGTGAVGGVRYHAVDQSKMTSTQKAVARIAEEIARVTGLDVRIADFGRGVGGEYFRGTGGTLFLNINAKYAGRNISIGSLTHELVHFLQEYSEDYAELKQAVLEEMARNPEEYEGIFVERARVQPNLTPDELTDEMVANALQKMLMDEETVQHMVQQHRGLMERIRDFFNKLIDDIKAAFSEMDFESDFTLNREVKAVENQLDRLRGIFDRAFSSAVENLQAEKAVGRTAGQTASQQQVFEEEVTSTEVGDYDFKDYEAAKGTDGNPLFQVYAFEHDEPEYREMLTKWGGMSTTQVDDLLKLVDHAMEIIKGHLEELDYAWETDIDDRSFQPVKQNSDKLYKVSQDFSTLCRKRILQGIISGQLSASLQRGLTKEEGIAVRDALMAIQEEGKQIEVACALCYVESARMRSQKAIQQFLNDPAAAIQNYYAGKSGSNATREAEMAEREKIWKEYGESLIRGKGDDETMYDIRDPKTATMAKIPTNLKKRIQDAKNAAKKTIPLTAEQQRTVELAKSLPVTAFTTPEGLQELAKNSDTRDIFNAFVLKVSAASKSKGIENDTWWRAGDSKAIGDTLIQQMNAENGLRTQSWSDFQVKHLMDYIAATIELSTRGAQQHAYTKVLDYVELMGNTGVMINMSLIPTREFNGTLEYDDVEGFKYKDAMRMREKFPDTAGTICIGMDDEQVRQLLASTDIDYVIPYHQSGMSKATRAAMHIPAWKDFQNYQGEKKLSRAEARANAEKYGVQLLSENDPLWHESPNFSDWYDLSKARQTAKKAGKTGEYGVMSGGYAAMQEAAENYKRICAERGLAPKFSYGKADFSNEANYWKLLIDRKMVNNKTGEIIEQKAIKPIFDFDTVQRILDDELERYGTVKADQEEAIERVTQAFLSGKVKGGMSSEAIAEAMKLPVDNVPITNITQNAAQMQVYNDKAEFVKDEALENNEPAVSEANVQFQRFTPESDSIRIQIQNAQDELNKMNVVAKVDATGVPKTVNRAVPWAVERLKHTGFKVDRQNFGVITFDEPHIREALRHITNHPDEFGAMLALPRVLKRGVIIDQHENHKGRVPDSFTIAAPVEVNGVRGNMAVIVQRTTKNYYHAHRVLLPDNSNFTFETANKKAVSKRTGELPDRALIAESVDTTNEKVSQSSENVNKQFQRWDDEQIRQFKQAQSDVIQKYHPKAEWDNQTWINSADDVRTFEEAVDGFEDGYVTPDYTAEDIKKALQTGTITVYSSHDIRKGTFVTPSLMLARDYAGSNNVKSKVVRLEEVAWIDEEQGQYTGIEPYNSVTAQFQRWDNAGEDTASEKKGREVAYARLQSENAILKDAVKSLKRLSGKQATTLANIQKQLQLTKTPETRLSDAKKLARAIIQEANSEADVDHVAERIKALGDYLLNTETGKVSEETLKGRARAIANEVLQGATEDVTLDEETMEVNPYEAYMGEAVEDLANRITMDALSGMLRETAPTKADKAKARTQALKDRIQNLRNEQKLSQREAASLYQTIYDLSVALDKAESKYKTLRTEADYRAAQIRAEGSARAAEIYARERARAEGLLKAQRETYQRMAKQARELRENSAQAAKYRKEIEKKVKQLQEMLIKNDDKVHVPEVLKEPLGDFLATIDLSSKTLLNQDIMTKADEKRHSGFLRMLEALENQQRYIDGEGEVQSDLGGYLDISQENLDFLRKTASLIYTSMQHGQTYTINRMNAGQLKQLSDFLSNLRTAINNMNSFMANARYESVKEAASADVDYMKSLGSVSEKSGSGIRKFLNWQNGVPYYIFKRFGAGGQAIFDGFTRGWEKMARNAKEIIDFTENAYKDKEVKAWKKQTHDFTLSDGSKITMTTAQIMELSQLLGREQALKHIGKGGVVIGEIKTKKGEITNVKQYHFTDEDIQKIVGALTPRQLEVAKKLQKFMADKGGEWGNEVSMRRFGYNFYTEGEHYYPIRTVDTDRPMADTDAQKNSMFRLLNLSASKSLNPKASNALVVNDIFDTFSDHMADMAKLNGMGLPILDAIKWFNYKERVDRGDGTYDTRTIQAAMKQAFGGEAGHYFRTLMKDINGQTETGDRGMFIGAGLLSNYKAAAVGANLRVAMLQPTSYVRARTVLKQRYLAGAFFHRNAYKEAMKYSGTAIWKSLGYYDTDISKSMRSQIVHDDTFKDKLVERSMRLAELGDKRTWGRLWVACKMQTRAETGLTGEALNEKTADLFREVIYSSQVMDATLTRSEIMRGKGVYSKINSAFMAEPTLSYNIVMDALSQNSLDKRAGKKNAGERAARLNKAILVYVNSAAFAAIVESLMDAARDDDDEAFWDKFLQAFLGEDKNGNAALNYSGNFMQDISILGKLPIFKNFVNNLQGYNKNGGDMAFAGFSNFVNALAIWRETILLEFGELKKPTAATYYGNMTGWGKLYKTLQALSQLSGVPYSNQTSDVVAIWNTFVAGDDPEMKIRTYDSKKDQTFRESVAPTGVTKAQYNTILDRADADGSGSVSQAELADTLQRAINAGYVTEKQAKAIWSSRFEKSWEEGLKAAEKAKEEAEYEASHPGYTAFKNTAPVYSDKKQAAYKAYQKSVKPYGISIDTYTDILLEADTGNGSVTQDELGKTLRKKIRQGELTYEEAEAIWSTLWNGSRSKTYKKWARSH